MIPWVKFINDYVPFALKFSCHTVPDYLIMAVVPYRGDCSITKRFISFTSSRIVRRNYHFRLYDRLSVGAKTFLNCDPLAISHPHILHDWTSNIDDGNMFNTIAPN
jgi:hypothetical protein